VAEKTFRLQYGETVTVDAEGDIQIEGGTIDKGSCSLTKEDLEQINRELGISEPDADEPDADEPDADDHSNLSLAFDDIHEVTADETGVEFTTTKDAVHFDWDETDRLIQFLDFAQSQYREDE
jgi:hypothetical protein